jgi:hypothetical protein
MEWRSRDRLPVVALVALLGLRNASERRIILRILGRRLDDWSARRARSENVRACRLSSPEIGHRFGQQKSDPFPQSKNAWQCGIGLHAGAKQNQSLSFSAA